MGIQTYGIWHLECIGVMGGMWPVSEDLYYAYRQLPHLPKLRVTIYSDGTQEVEIVETSHVVSNAAR